jgi:PST family polysaccharide transporter
MYRALRLTSLYGLASGIGLAILSRDAIGLFFGHQWRSGIDAMTVLCLAAGVESTTYASGPLFPAIGKPGTLVAVNVPLTIVRIGGFILAAPYGIFWVAVVHLATNAVTVVTRIGITNRVAGTTTKDQLRALVPAVAVAVGVTAGALPIRLAMSGGAPTFGLTIACGLIGALIALAVADRSTFAEVRALTKTLGDRT